MKISFRFQIRVTIIYLSRPCVFKKLSIQEFWAGCDSPTLNLIESGYLKFVMGSIIHPKMKTDAPCIISNRFKKTILSDLDSNKRVYFRLIFIRIITHMWSHWRCRFRSLLVLLAFLRFYFCQKKAHLISKII